jgi:hypothetical protein
VREAKFAGPETVILVQVTVDAIRFGCPGEHRHIRGKNPGYPDGRDRRTLRRVKPAVSVRVRPGIAKVHVIDIAREHFIFIPVPGDRQVADQDGTPKAGNPLQVALQLLRAILGLVS